MEPLLKFLMTNIVDRPEAVTVTAQTDPDGTVVLTAAVDPADMGKIIGRGGKVIGAIRELLKVKAVKTNQRVRLVLAEPTTQTDRPSPPPPPAPPAETP